MSDVEAVSRVICDGWKKHVASEVAPEVTQQAQHVMHGSLSVSMSWPKVPRIFEKKKRKEKKKRGQ